METLPVWDRLDIGVDGDWLASDFEIFLQAVRQIYDIGLAAYLAGQIGQGEQVARRQEIAAFEPPEIRIGLERASPNDPEVVVVSGAAPEVADVVSQAMRELIPSIQLEPELASPTQSGAFFLGAAYKDLAAIAPESQLRIGSIQMASLGKITLEGIGEPLAELRKLILGLFKIGPERKRLKIENKAAEDREMLEAAQRRLELVEQSFRTVYGPEFRQVPGIADQIRDAISAVGKLGRFVDSGQLLLPPPAE